MHRGMHGSTNGDVLGLLLRPCMWQKSSVGLGKIWSCRPLHTTPWPERVSRLRRVRFDRGEATGGIRRAALSFRVRAPPIAKSVGFVGGVSTLTYLACANWSVHENKRLLQDANASSLFSSIATFFGARRNLDLLVQTDKAEYYGQLYRRLSLILHDMPFILRRTCLGLYERAVDAYLAMPTYQQTAVPIIAVNTAVFAAWLVSPALGTTVFMRRYFTHRPTSGRMSTMLTSVFSHRGLAHFAFNNLALWSVGSCAIECLWRDRSDLWIEANTGPHFFAFYIAAGLFASLASHLAAAGRWRQLVTAPPTRAFSQLRSLAVRSSLGASGAIYAAFALCALTMPQVQLRCVALFLTISIIFLPMFTFPIQWGFGSLVLLDTIGILRGWRVFDHYAHLGGALFGAVYYFIGPPIWGTCKQAMAQVTQVNERIADSS